MESIWKKEQLKKMLLNISLETANLNNCFLYQEDDKEEFHQCEFPNILWSIQQLIGVLDLKSCFPKLNECYWLELSKYHFLEVFHLFPQTFCEKKKILTLYPSSFSKVVLPYLLTHATFQIFEPLNSVFAVL